MNVPTTFEEMLAVRQIADEDLDTTVRDRSRQYISLVQDPESKEWGFEPVGRIHQQRFRDPKQAGTGIVTSLAYTPDGQERSYSLGSYKSDAIIDPQMLISPFMDLGWEVGDHYTRRGGSSAYTTLYQPEKAWDDPIGWDHLDQMPIHPGVAIRTDPKRGVRPFIMAGWFRMVCTNGLVVKELNFGHLEINQGLKPLEGILEDVQGFARMVSDKEEWDITKQLRAPFPGRSASFIEGLLRNEERDNPRPTFISNPLNTLLRCFQVKELEVLPDQLMMIAEADEYTILDLANLFTNVSNTARSQIRIEAGVDSLFQLSEIGEYLTR